MSRREVYQDQCGDPPSPWIAEPAILAESAGRAREHRSGRGHTGTSPPTVSALNFDTFYVGNFDRLVRRLTPLCRNGRGQAEDVAQESFLQAYRHWDRLRQPEQAYPWISRIALRLCYALWEKQDRQRRLHRELVALVPRVSREEDISTLLDLSGELMTLPPRQRTVAAMAFLLEMSPTEIAAELGVAPSTVRVHLHAVRRRLRQSSRDWDSLNGDKL